jgi:hypothetical protein
MSESAPGYNPLEFMDAMALHLNLQSMRVSAIKADERRSQDLDELKDSDLNRYHHTDTYRRVAPLDLDVIARGPKPRDAEHLPTAELPSFRRINLYFPEDDFQPEQLPAGKDRWDDVFLELVGDDGSTERLLFNAEKLVGYQEADDLEPSDIAGFTGVYYHVKPSASVEPSVSLKQLEQLIYDYDYIVE